MALNTANKFDGNPELLNKLTEEDIDFIYGIADGLEEKFLNKMLGGRASYTVLCTWNPAAIENRVDSNLSKLKNIRKSLNLSLDNAE